MECLRREFFDCLLGAEHCEPRYHPQSISQPVPGYEDDYEDFEHYDHTSRFYPGAGQRYSYVDEGGYADGMHFKDNASSYELRRPAPYGKDKLADVDPCGT